MSSEAQESAGTLNRWWWFFRRRWDRSQRQLDRSDVLAKVASDSRLTGRFVLMTVAAAGIAVLGLIQNSVAVVIGAMLIAPLMDPIMGLGFGICVGDTRFIRRAGSTLLIGVALSIAVTALIGWASPLDGVTSEIAARTQPTLLDLVIALLGGVAGAYAVVKGQQGRMIGVAIATALMPPLAVVGFGLATQRWSVAGGAALLFATNFVAISLVTTIVARIYGFRSSDTPSARWQGIGILATFAVLATPLALGLSRIAWTERAQAQADRAIKAAFGPRTRVSDLAVSRDGDAAAVRATVLTAQAERVDPDVVKAELEREWGREVMVDLTQLRVASAAALEQVETALAKSDGAAARSLKADGVRVALAAVAGVTPDEVLVDSSAQRAIAQAAPVAGADLSFYRELERRAAAQAGTGWDVRLTPPRLELESIPAANADGHAEAVALAAWASQRTGAALEIGPGPRAEALAAAGARVVTRAGASPTRPRWVEAPPPAAPAEAAARADREPTKE